MSKYNYLFTSSHFVTGALHLGGFPKLSFFHLDNFFSDVLVFYLGLNRGMDFFFLKGHFARRIYQKGQKK
jgi:hypothetical protein